MSEHRTIDQQLLWECYVAISNWDARYNGRPSSHKESNEKAEAGLAEMLDKLGAHFHAGEVTSRSSETRSRDGR